MVLLDNLGSRVSRARRGSLVKMALQVRMVHQDLLVCVARLARTAQMARKASRVSLAVLVGQAGMGETASLVELVVLAHGVHQVRMEPQGRWGQQVSQVMTVLLEHLARTGRMGAMVRMDSKAGLVKPGTEGRPALLASLVTRAHLVQMVLLAPKALQALLAPPVRGGRQGQWAKWANKGCLDLLAGKATRVAQARRGKMVCQE